MPSKSVPASGYRNPPGGNLPLLTQRNVLWCCTKGGCKGRRDDLLCLYSTFPPQWPHTSCFRSAASLRTPTGRKPLSTRRF